MGTDDATDPGGRGAMMRETAPEREMAAPFQLVAAEAPGNEEAQDSGIEQVADRLCGKLALPFRFRRPRAQRRTQPNASGAQRLERRRGLDRESVEWGTSVAGRVEPGGGGIVIETTKR